MNVNSIQQMYFCINEFEVGIHNSIISGNEQQKVYVNSALCMYMLASVIIFVLVNPNSSSWP